MKQKAEIRKRNVQIVKDYKEMSKNPELKKYNVMVAVGQKYGLNRCSINRIVNEKIETTVDHTERNKKIIADYEKLVAKYPEKKKYSLLNQLGTKYNLSAPMIHNIVHKQ